LKGILRCCCNLGISSRFIADSASVAAPDGDRFGVGIRFQGQGYFLTDASMHRGTSGAPVVARMMERSGRADSRGCCWACTPRVWM